MKQKLIISVLILALGTLMQAQTLIGLSKEEVRARVKKEHREFRKDDSVVKQRFNYLKYVNRMRTKTWIIYFTEEDIARTSKLICDYGEYDEMVEGLNQKYVKTGEYFWEYTSGEDTLQVEVLKQEWYFTIRERKKETAGGQS